jgi:hypothetical protein
MNRDRIIVSVACFSTALRTLASALSTTGDYATLWGIFLAVCAAIWVALGVKVLKWGVR